jgi:hypothetical protein
MAKHSTQTASRSGTRGRQQQGINRNRSKEQSGEEQGGNWQGMISQRKHQMDEMMHDHEGQSVLIALVAGFGIGYLIGCALASDDSSSYSRWSSRLPDRSTAEGIGRRVMDSLDRVLPEAISSRFSS